MGGIPVKETKKSAVIYGAFASINIILNIILVPIIGIVGAAIATLVTFTIHLLVVSTISFQRMSYDIDFKFIMKSITASVIMAFIVWKLNPYGAVSILISIGIATGFYFGVLIPLRGFTRVEFEFLKSIVQSVF